MRKAAECGWPRHFAVRGMDKREMKNFDSKTVICTLRLVFTFAVFMFAAFNTASGQTNQGIRKTNLKDASYRDAMKYLKEDWGADTEWAMESNVADFSANKYTFGDLNGDSVEEAAVWVQYTMGGSGSVNRVFVYELVSDLPEFIATVASGDRAQEGIKSVRIVGGQLLVETYLPNDFCMACYSSKTATTKYQLGDGELINVGRVLNQNPAEKRVRRARRKTK